MVHYGTIALQARTRELTAEMEKLQAELSVLEAKSKEKGISFGAELGNKKSLKMKQREIVSLRASAHAQGVKL